VVLVDKALVVSYFILKIQKKSKKAAGKEMEKRKSR